MNYRRTERVMGLGGGRLREKVSQTRVALSSNSQKEKKGGGTIPPSSSLCIKLLTSFQY